jgi:GH24 family phage-related lysozyme (muramidase)
MEVLSHEAIVTKRYKDSVGVWTIAAGHTAAAGGVDPDLVKRELTVEECLQIFIEDVKKFEARVDKHLSKDATQMEFDAAVSFDFNTGAIHKATWVKQFNKGDKAAAVKNIMNWRKPPEIIERRSLERDLLAGKGYSHSGKVSVYPASPTGAVQWSKGKRVDAMPLLVRALQKRPVSPTEPVPAPQPPPPPDIPKPAPAARVGQTDSASKVSGYIGVGIFLAIVAFVAIFMLLT